MDASRKTPDFWTLFISHSRYAAIFKNDPPKG